MNRAVTSGETRTGPPGTVSPASSGSGAFGNDGCGSGVVSIPRGGGWFGLVGGGGSFATATA